MLSKVIITKALAFLYNTAMHKIISGQLMCYLISQYQLLSTKGIQILTGIAFTI